MSHKCFMHSTSVSVFHLLLDCFVSPGFAGREETFLSRRGIILSVEVWPEL